MKRTIGLILIFAATLALAHSVHLKDGSRLEGEVLLLNEQSLILSTSFAGTLTLDRGEIAAIVFSEGFLAPAPAKSDLPPLVPESTQLPVDGSGVLELSIEGDPAKSSVRFMKDSEREAMTALNALHLRVYMDGREVAHVTDPEIEKEFRRGKWLVQRNSHRFEPLRMDLPAGRHRIQIVVGNDTSAFDHAIDQELLSSEVLIEDVDILPDQKTRIVLQGNSGRLGSYGSYKMKVLSSR